MHHNRDSVFNSARRATELIVAKEWSRRERVDVCILQGDKESLSLQASFDSERIKQLQADSSAFYDVLNKANIKLHEMYDDLQRQNCNLADLHQELELQEIAAPDHQKILSDNNGLTQRLKSLQSELNTLRFQQNENRDILSQKLALERQLSSLEMELSIARDELQSLKLTTAENDHESNMHTHVDKFAEQLSQEVQKRQQLEKRIVESQDYHDSRSKVLESKLDALKAKLSGARTELKQTQAQLLEARRIGSSSLDSEAAQSRRRAKRGLIEQHDESKPNTVNLPYLANNSNHASTRLGEKSSFSLTPILQKTSNIIAGATDLVESEMEPKNDLVRSVAPVSTHHMLTQNTREVSEVTEPHSLDNVQYISGEGIRYLTERDKPSRHIYAPTDGEDDESNKDSNLIMKIMNQQSNVRQNGGSLQSLKPKKVHVDTNESDNFRRRRKLPGGQSHLFSDDEEEEVPFKDVGIISGTIPLGIGKIGSLKPPLGQVSVNRWDQRKAKFSPLKREKRAIQARS